MQRRESREINSKGGEKNRGRECQEDTMLEEKGSEIEGAREEDIQAMVIGLDKLATCWVY